MEHIVVEIVTDIEWFWWEFDAFRLTVKLLLWLTASSNHHLMTTLEIASLSLTTINILILGALIIQWLII